MSDVLTTTSASPQRPDSNGSARPPTSPDARRVRRPKWRDTRLLIGVLLILASIVLGARLVKTATATSSWLSVTHGLPAGHVLAAEDLKSVKAHLPASASRRYFTVDGSALVGRVLSRPVAAGELLAADAVEVSGQQPPSRVVPLLVKAGRLPTLSPGDHVDVYVLERPSGGAGRETRVLTDVEFVGQDVLSSGDASLQLRVPPADAPSAIAASQSERVDVVRVDNDSADHGGDPGPTSVRAYGGG